MPFIVPETVPHHLTDFYLIRAMEPHVGLSFITLKKAFDLQKKSKKILIFDTLLGLKNLPIKGADAEKILSVLQGKLPLTELIQSHQELDIISGQSSLNFMALDSFARQNLYQQLQQLATNYDAVLLDCPACIDEIPPFKEAQTLWVSPPYQASLLKILSAVDLTQTVHLILNCPNKQSDPAQVLLFLKQFYPMAQVQQLIPFASDKK